MGPESATEIGLHCCSFLLKRFGSPGLDLIFKATCPHTHCATMASTLEQAERGIACPPATDLPVVKGIPVRAGPGVIGARVSHLQPPPVAVPATLLDMDEQAGYPFQKT